MEIVERSWSQIKRDAENCLNKDRDSVSDFSDHSRLFEVQVLLVCCYVMSHRFQDFEDVSRLYDLFQLRFRTFFASVALHFSLSFHTHSLLNSAHSLHPPLV